MISAALKEDVASALKIGLLGFHLAILGFLYPKKSDGTPQNRQMEPRHSLSKSSSIFGLQGCKPWSQKLAWNRHGRFLLGLSETRGLWDFGRCWGCSISHTPLGKIHSSSKDLLYDLLISTCQSTILGNLVATCFPVMTPQFSKPKKHMPKNALADQTFKHVPLNQVKPKQKYIRIN